jgi:tetratricopeptide (TPR) repeat protein
MAKVFLELSMPKEALKAADDAIAGLHFPTTIFSYRAKAFILLNRLDEAEEAAEEGIRQMRSIGTSYEVRAEVSFKRGLHEEAIVYARKALECTPLLPRAHHLIALSLDGLGRSREGTAVLIAAPNEELQELGWDRKDEEFRTFSLTRCPNHSDQLPNLMGPASAMPDFSCGAEALQAAPAAPVQEPSVRPTPPQSVQRVIDRIQGKAPAPVRRR